MSKTFFKWDEDSENFLRENANLRCGEIAKALSQKYGDVSAAAVRQKIRRLDIKRPPRTLEVQECKNPDVKFRWTMEYENFLVENLQYTDIELAEALSIMSGHKIEPGCVRMKRYRLRALKQKHRKETRKGKPQGRTLNFRWTKALEDFIIDNITMTDKQLARSLSKLLGTRVSWIAVLFKRNRMKFAKHKGQGCYLTDECITKVLARRDSKKNTPQQKDEDVPHTDSLD